MMKYNRILISAIVILSFSLSPVCRAIDETLNASAPPLSEVEVSTPHSSAVQTEQDIESSDVAVPIEDIPTETPLAVPPMEVVVQTSAVDTDVLMIGRDSSTQIQYYTMVITTVQTSGGTGRTSEELIEIANNSDVDLDITHWKIVADPDINKLYEFLPENSDPGHFVVLPARRNIVLTTAAFLAAHPGFVADGTFANGKLANANGSIRIVDAAGVPISGIAWGSGSAADGSPFPTLSSSGGVLARRVLPDGWYQDTHQNRDDFLLGALRESYATGFLVDRYDACLNIVGVSALIPEGWMRDPLDGTCHEKPVVSVNNCEMIQLSEIGANMQEQFIELYNSSDAAQDLQGCTVMTNRSTTVKFVFDDESLEPHAYRMIKVSDTKLTLTKTTAGTVYLLSSDGLTEVDSVAYANLQADTSWSRIDGQWAQTYMPTPSAANQAMIYPACSQGYERNILTGRCNKVAIPNPVAPCGDNQYRSEETGRCRTVVLATALKPCKEGQYRSEETNRCRSIATAVSTVKPCDDDQFRNPATGRCKKIASTDDLPKPCPSGQERNLETNRCRKIVASVMPAAAFPVESIKDTSKAFVAWWALGGVMGAGLVYAAWEWRYEIGRTIARAGTLMHRR